MQNFKWIFVWVLFLQSAASWGQSNFVIGQDISYVNMMEDCGAVFREDGAVKDVYQIFSDNGTNLIRVRIWHNPTWMEDIKQPNGVKAQYSNLEDVKKTITRAKAAGMEVMLGFHFSDFWSDPGRQIVPKAWDAIALNETVLRDSVYNYVFKVLSHFNSLNIMPEYVKIGNENNSGIMTHKGMDSNYNGITRLSSSWARHGRLYNAAISAVRAVSVNASIQPKIALHVADHTKATWFYNNIKANGVTDFDIMGFTYYYAYHGGSPSAVGGVIKSLLQSHPGYEAMIVETGYLWDTENIDEMNNIISEPSPAYLPVSPVNQKKFMVDLSNEVKNAGGSGLIFWESAWVSTPCYTPWGRGSAQEHVAFFDHRNQLNYMKNGGGGWPDAFLNGEKTESRVDFKVDMSGQDVSRGVFLVGTPTNWQFVALTDQGNSVYTTSMNITIGGHHAYYYITSNSWDDFQAYRETVPEACATSDVIMNDPGWTTDRAFIVPETDTVMGVKWGSCEVLPTSISNVLTSEHVFSVFPNPSNDGSLQIIIHGDFSQGNDDLSIYNAMGVNQGIHFNRDGAQWVTDGSELSRGIYFVKLTLNNRSFVQKVLIL